MFLGFSYGIKGYKLLNLETQCLFISREVIFHELYFPFKNSDVSTSIPQSKYVVPLSAPDSSSYTSDTSILESILASHEITSDYHDQFTIPPPRRSNCTRNPPSYLQDYHCQLIHSFDKSLPLDSKHKGF